MSARAESIRKSAPAKRDSHLRVVDKRTKSKKRKSRGKAAGITTSLVLAGAIVMGVLLEQVTLAQSAFELSKIRREFAVAEARHEELLLEAARLDSATRVERFARRSLGMVDPAPGQVEYIVADVRTGTSLDQSTIHEGDEANAPVTGIRSAASYGGSP